MKPPSVHSSRGLLFILVCLGTVTVILAAQQRPVVVNLQDYAALPVTGRADGIGQADGLLARVNGLVEEPGGANRYFVPDLNGPLYILDKRSKQWTTYLDFNGRDGHAGMFPRFAYAAGYANGLVSLAFDPDYRRNGRFYTIHIEEPTASAPMTLNRATVPALVGDYTTTTPLATPGEVAREAVLIEWTDTNASDASFEGSAREVLRVQLNTRIHPLSAMTFNPAARPGDTDWRALYLGCGDGGSGESRQAIRSNPQRLDTVVGKILRIIPDVQDQRPGSVLSDNGRYRIPADNPFLGALGARKEIWAYGFRNPHRLTWMTAGTSGGAPLLVANSIGLHTWETVNIVHRGANYGYSLREGNQSLGIDNQTAPLPARDVIPARISDSVTAGTVVPSYPVVQYSHQSGGGDAIGSGFAYLGTVVPELRGKYVFTDITTGRIWYADVREMVAADDGDPTTLAKTSEVHVRWSGAPGTPPVVYPTMFPITEQAYHDRGGKAVHLPGAALVSAQGRADVQLATDSSGELFIVSKSDGMIRAVVGSR